MIKEIDNIILLGTSHVAKESKELIEKTIEKEKPELVTIELDIDRLKTLLSNNKKRKLPVYKTAREVGLTGLIFALIAGYAQKKIGNSLGIEPGLDMKTAFTKAREEKIATALIDIPIKHTLNKMSAIPMRKKLSMLKNLLKKSMSKKYAKELQFDVKKGVPDEKFINSAMKIIEKELPPLYKILIEDRNDYMSKRLLKLRETHKGKIIAVVGAGHVSGMYEILKKEIDTHTQNIYSFTITADSTENYNFTNT